MVERRRIAPRIHYIVDFITFFAVSESLFVATLRSILGRYGQLYGRVPELGAAMCCPPIRTSLQGQEKSGIKGQQRPRSMRGYKGRSDFPRQPPGTQLPSNSG